MSGLEKMLNPRTTAVVGVSTKNPFFPGNVILRKLRFESDLPTFAINPKGGMVEGQKVYKSILETPDGIDLAVISVPSKYVPGIIEQCGSKKIPSVIVYLEVSVK